MQIGITKNAKTEMHTLRDTANDVARVRLRHICGRPRRTNALPNRQHCEQPGAAQWTTMAVSTGFDLPRGHAKTP
eukprot:5281515-Pyramimonas_sp.AAC.1